MELSEQHLETIGNYVRQHLPEWMVDIVQLRESDTRERLVRVEEGLKALREVTFRGFDQLNRRMDDQEKRADQTRDDLSERIDGVRDDLSERIDGVRNDLTERIDGFRSDLTASLDRTRQEMDVRFGDLNRHMNRWFVAITAILGLLSIAMSVRLFGL